MAKTFCDGCRLGTVVTDEVGPGGARRVFCHFCQGATWTDTECICEPLILRAAQEVIRRRELGLVDSLTQYEKPAPHPLAKDFQF